MLRRQLRFSISSSCRYLRSSISHIVRPCLTLYPKGVYPQATGGLVPLLRVRTIVSDGRNSPHRRRSERGGRRRRTEECPG